MTEDTGGGYTNTIYRDAVTLLLIGFICMVVWMLPHLNPPAEVSKMDPPGNLVASIVWPEGAHDVDLWVSGPGEPVPVGYSNKGGLLWNLLRDDLGKTADATPLNFEHSFTRGLPPGDYRVNVHCYNCPTLPVEVDLEVSIKGGVEERMKTVSQTHITLNKNHEEKTGIAFSLDGDGRVIPESLNTVFEPLRTRRGK